MPSMGTMGFQVGMNLSLRCETHGSGHKNWALLKERRQVLRNVLAQPKSRVMCDTGKAASLSLAKRFLLRIEVRKVTEIPKRNGVLPCYVKDVLYH